MGVRRSATAEFWLTVGSLSLAVCILVVILGAEGGFADRIEQARMSARGDVVRIRPLPITKQDAQGRETFEIVDAAKLEVILSKTTMGQEIAASSSPCMTRPGDVAAGMSPWESPGFGTPTLSYLAVTPNYFRVMGLKVSEGRIWESREAEEGREMAVVGRVLGDSLPVGSVISHPDLTEKANRTLQEYLVTGILAETGDAYAVSIPGTKGSSFETAETMSGLDYTAFLPLGVVRAFVLRPPPAGVIEPRGSRLGLELLVRPTPGREEESIAEVEDIIRSLGHDIAEVRPESQTQLIYTRVSGNVSKLFLYVAMISLALSGVNLTNLVLVRVIRESRYIGIRRATGASQLRILWETVRVSIAVASLGAVLGLGASLVAQVPLSRLVGQACRVDLRAALLGCGLLMLIAVFAALYPAWRAARTQPVTMIRFGLVSSAKRRLRFDARDALAALGIVVGVAAVTSIVAIGEGGQREVDRYLEAAGRDILIVREPDPFVTGELETRLTPRFAETLDTVPGIEGYGWQEWGHSTVGSQDRSQNPYLVACDPALLELRQLSPVGGTLSEGDPDAVVLGHRIAESLFGPETQDAIGQSIWVKGARFTVAGILPRRPKNVLDQGYDRDNAVFAVWTPELSDLAFATVWPTREFWIKARAGSFTEVKGHLDSIAEDGRFRVGAPVGELRELRDLNQDLTRMLSVLAAFGLFIGAAGVSGFMYVRVAEDARRTGILRAVGASRGNIMLTYLRQSIQTCVQAGILGLTLALVLVRLIFSNRGWPFYISWTWASLALGVSAIAGVLAGWLPSSRASSLNPVEAIRQE